MKQVFLFLTAVALLVAACEDYGKKVAINEWSEVFYKGDSVTEGDAKKLGDFLMQQGFFSTTVHRSVQLLKENDVYVVKLVVDQDKLNKDKDNVLTSFKVWQWMISENVFNNGKTKLVLADDKLNSTQEVGEFTEQEKSALLQETGPTGETPQAATPADSTTIIRQ